MSVNIVYLEYLRAAVDWLHGTAKVESFESRQKLAVLEYNIQVLARACTGNKYMCCWPGIIMPPKDMTFCRQREWQGTAGTLTSRAGAWSPSCYCNALSSKVRRDRVEGLMYRNA